LEIKKLDSVTLPFKMIDLPSYAAFSDLHVMTGGPADDFQPYRFKFHHAVDFCLDMEIPSSRIIYPGDTVDMAELKDGENFDDVRQVYSKTIGILQLGQVLTGNHDPKNPLAHSDTFDTGGEYSFHFEHGHKAEWLFTGRWRWVGWLGCKFSGFLERLGIKNIDKTPAQVNDKAFKKHFERKFEKYVLNHLEKNSKMKVLIFGHTHRPFLKLINTTSLGPRIVANCGDFVGHCTFITYIDRVLTLWQVVD